MARFGMLRLRGDERRLCAGGHARRVHVQPQLRRPSRQGRAHASDESGDGRSRCGHGSRNRRADVNALVPKTFNADSGRSTRKITAVVAGTDISSPPIAVMASKVHMALIGANVGFADYLSPFRDFALEVGGKFV